MAVKPIKSSDFATFNEISATCFTPQINIISQKLIQGVNTTSCLLLKPSCVVLQPILTGLWMYTCLLPMKLIILVINFFFVTRLQLYVHNYVRVKSQENVHVEGGI